MEKYRQILTVFEKFCVFSVIGKHTQRNCYSSVLLKAADSTSSFEIAFKNLGSDLIKAVVKYYSIPVPSLQIEPCLNY